MAGGRPPDNNTWNAQHAGGKQRGCVEYLRAKRQWGLSVHFSLRCWSDRPRPVAHHGHHALYGMWLGMCCSYSSRLGAPRYRAARASCLFLFNFSFNTTCTCNVSLFSSAFHCFSHLPIARYPHDTLHTPPDKHSFAPPLHLLLDMARPPALWAPMHPRRRCPSCRNPAPDAQVA